MRPTSALAPMIRAAREVAAAIASSGVSDASTRARARTATIRRAARSRSSLPSTTRQVELAAASSRGEIQCLADVRLRKFKNFAHLRAPAAENRPQLDVSGAGPFCRLM